MICGPAVNDLASRQTTWPRGTGRAGDLHPACAEVSDFTPKAGWPPAMDGASGSIMTFDNGDGKEINSRHTEMWSACTQNGAHTFVSGDEYEPGRCNDLPLSLDEMLPADSQTTCEGGYARIFFLQGNAWEWEGGCQWESHAEALGPSFCLIRGPAGCESQPGGPMTGFGPLEWNEFLGIRCCADAIEGG